MKRHRQLFVPTIVLDRASSTPLNRQVCTQIAGAIRSGTEDGARLPSTRLLARLLGVSRNTVLAAYDELVANGLLEGRRGAAMLITAGKRTAPAMFDLTGVLRDAQYPARTVSFEDLDGTSLYLTY